jgi:hypothetical protein
MGDRKEQSSWETTKEQWGNGERARNKRQQRELNAQGKDNPDWHRNREKEQGQAHGEEQHRRMEQPAGTRVSHLPLDGPSKHLVFLSRVPGEEVLSCS